MRTFVERVNAVRVETPFGTVTNFPLCGRVPSQIIETDAPWLDHVTVRLPRPIPALRERRIIVEEPVFGVAPCPCCGEIHGCDNSNLEDVILDLAGQIRAKRRDEARCAWGWGW